MKSAKTVPIIAIAILMLAFGNSAAETDGKVNRQERQTVARKPATATPYYEVCTHNYNNLILPVSNMGFFGGQGSSYRDCETGQPMKSGEFPAGTGVEYLYAASLWIGAVVGNDTVVSVGIDGWQHINEMWPCASSECGIQRRSSRPSDLYYHPEARSDLEYVAVYADTLKDQRWCGSDWDGRAHIPLGLEITQTSYSWTLPQAQDFIIIDYSIRNFGGNVLRDMFIGLFIDGDVGHIFHDLNRYYDDICGFRPAVPSVLGHNLQDTVNLAWIADNDGDPLYDEYGNTSATSIAGVRVLRWPTGSEGFSFNWWMSNGNSRFDWGPMYEPRFDFGTGGLGTPEGDRGKYYVLSNDEIDYDQIYAAQDFCDLGWLPPSDYAAIIAGGGDDRCLTSGGPFEMQPEETISFTVAYVAGEHFHQDPMNFDAHMDQLPQDPDGFYWGLNFGDIGLNAAVAGRIFDNPGVDSDGDGRAGRFWVLVDTVGGKEVIDTFYYAGDGVPDLTALVRLPAPKLRFLTTDGVVTLRWNGLRCERFIDPVSLAEDFEGYRIYMGREPRLDRLALLNSYDLFDFAVRKWDGVSRWITLQGGPRTLKEILKMFPCDDCDLSDPTDYPCGEGGSGFEYGRETYCFAPVGWNQSIPGWDDAAPEPPVICLRKRFLAGIEEGEITPEIDTLNDDLWLREYDPATGDSVLYHKYYEYEYIIGDLLESVPHYLSVTAFDFGDMFSEYSSVETSPLDNVVEVWAVNSADSVVRKGLEVRVYPNPYVRGGAAPPEASPSYESGIVFGNLPPRCTIKIFTISGDLVRELSHPSIYSDTDSQIRWDLRNKKERLVKSGIFLYAVESPWGDQIGKLVIIQ